jgi:hypothetical protein
MIAKTDRVRAWVLLRVAEPHSAAAMFDKRDRSGRGLLTEGGDQYVVVRADVVEGSSVYNLVVPIDAQDEAGLSAAIHALSSKLGAQPEQTMILRVVSHYPKVPHNAHSFVTPKELKGKPAPEFDPPGRHWPKSPGANPWG